MINPEDDLPKPKRALLVPPPLDSLGAEELRDYIADLEREIARVGQKIKEKEAHRSAAAALFKARD
jgi:uncharacterized small protein (DUF1192 family)